MCFGAPMTTNTSGATTARGSPSLKYRNMSPATKTCGWWRKWVCSTVIAYTRGLSWNPLSAIGRPSEQG